MKETEVEKGTMEGLLYHLALHYRWKLPCIASVVYMSVQWTSQDLPSQKGSNDAVLDTFYQMVNFTSIYKFTVKI